MMNKLQEVAPTGRGNSMQGIQNYAITDNPVFKVHIRTLATNYEQPAGGKEKKGDQDDPTKKFKIGQKITGKEKGSDKAYSGKIVKMSKGDSTIVIIDEETEKEIKLDASSCVSTKKEVDGGDIELPFTSENYLLSLEEFINENY